MIRSWLKTVVAGAVACGLGSAASAQSLPDIDSCRKAPVRACLGVLLDQLEVRVKAEQNGIRKKEILSAITVQLLANGHHEFAERFARLLSDRRLRERNLAAIATSHARLNRRSEARRILQLINAPSVRGLVLAAIGTAHVDAKVRADNFSAIAKQPAGAARSAVYAGIAAAAAEGGDHDEAKRVARLIGDPMFRAMVFAGVARQQAAAGAVDAAVQTAAQIISLDGRRRALAVLAKALHANGKRALARALVADAASTLDKNADTDANRQWHLYRLALDASAVGDPALARQLAGRLKSPARRAEALQRIGADLIKQGRRDHARELFTEGAAVLSELPKQSRSPGLRSRLINGLAGSGALKQALTLARTIDDPRRRARAEQEVGSIVLERNDAAAAEQIYRAIEDTDYRNDGLLDLALALAKQDQRATALTLVAEVTKSVPSRAATPGAQRIFRRLAIVEATLGRIEPSLAAVKAMAADGDRLRTMLTIVEQARGNGQSAISKRMLREALLALAAIKPENRKPEWLSRLVVVLLEAGLPHEARRLIDDTTTADVNNRVISEAAFALYRRKKFVHAEALVRDLANSATRKQFELIALNRLAHQAMTAN